MKKPQKKESGSTVFIDRTTEKLKKNPQTVEDCLYNLELLLKLQKTNTT